MIIMYMHIWTRNMCSAVHSIGYVKNQFLFYRIFQSLWSVWRAFWRDMVIMYVQILTKNMCLAVHIIGYLRNQFYSIECSRVCGVCGGHSGEI